MNTLANLFAYYNNGEHDVYHFVLGKILENTDLFLNRSIYEIADYCSSSTATISRLAQKLGYKNFSDFKHNLFDAFHYYQYNNLVMPEELKLQPGMLAEAYFDAFRQLIDRVSQVGTDENIGRVVDLLHQAKHVRIFSFNTEFSDVSLQINLLMSGKESLLCNRFPEQVSAAKELTEKDVVLILAPDSSDALDVIPLTQIIHERGARCVLITNSTHCIHIGRVDHALAFEGTSTNLDLQGMYMLIDLICMAYRKRYVQAMGESESNKNDGK